MSNIGYIIGIIGCWIISDAIYSWVLYKHTQSWRGDKQNFAKDHWLRLVRCISGVVLMILGWFLV